jgi:hypothetical protein
VRRAGIQCHVKRPLLFDFNQISMSRHVSVSVISNSMAVRLAAEKHANANVDFTL